MMSLRLLVIASLLACLLLLVQQVISAPLEDQLPDTTGLFFGKRAHPHMSSLMFGKRDYNPYDVKFTYTEAKLVCRSVKRSCEEWGVYM